MVVPRSGRARAAAYLRQLDEDLKRYRRQFVLADRRKRRCQLAPSDEEKQAGVMVFAVPAEEGFHAGYEPTSEHRPETLKMTLAAGASDYLALVAVPLKGTGGLQATGGMLRCEKGGAIPAGAIEIRALKSMPVVWDGRVHDRPFLPDPAHTGVEERGIYWFLLRLTAPPNSRDGVYAGDVRFGSGSKALRVPLEVTVRRLQEVNPGDDYTFGVWSSGDSEEIYRSLSRLLPEAKANVVSRSILEGVFSAGLNAHEVAGPRFRGDLDLYNGEMIECLRRFVPGKPQGKVLVILSTALRQLRQNPAAQPSTARYRKALARAVQSANSLASQRGLTDYALACGRFRDVGIAAGMARMVRAAGGRPAVTMDSRNLQHGAAARLGNLTKHLDTLIISPQSKGVVATRDQFKSDHPEKHLLLTLESPSDMYGVGFYAWAVGADGAYVSRIFESGPPYNAFHFPDGSLILPERGGRFRPTLGLVLLSQGIDDYHLARRCEALLAEARRRKVEAAGLDTLLRTIRGTCDAHPPRFDSGRFLTGPVKPDQLRKWRQQLAEEAGKVSEALQ
jgi:hypothetical protein